MLRASVKLAAVVVAAGIAAAACAPVQMGAAAIVGEQRIATATLAAQVANLSSAYQADRGKIQISYSRDQMPQLVLSWLLRFRIRRELAARLGISPTPAQIQQSLAGLSAAIRSQSATATLAEVGVANGLPPDLLPQLGSYQAIQTALTNRLDGGRVPTQPAAQQALQARFARAECVAAKRLDIKVNPQFGVLDYSQLTVVPSAGTLSRPASSLSPSAAPNLKPSC